MWYNAHALRPMINRLLGKKSDPKRRSQTCISCSEELWRSFKVLIWKSWINGWSIGNGIKWCKDDSCVNGKSVTIDWKAKWMNTSSPSPIQLANKSHADQFQRTPAMERRTFSIASSRLDSRERNNALLNGEVKLRKIGMSVVLLTGTEAKDL